MPPLNEYASDGASVAGGTSGFSPNDLAPSGDAFAVGSLFWEFVIPLWVDRWLAVRAADRLMRKIKK